MESPIDPRPSNRGSWGPCVLAQTQKSYEKGIRGISWGPLLTQGPRAVPEFPNGQSAPGNTLTFILSIAIQGKIISNIM
ncbi:unnamed protein product [Staurois parvus]|uniref:Uncharacterized protein n=1 Tax=Staurois parvus TaxID=386267 RepID=A0ABN9GGM2_9NEOB|nr:unnamed protein product [Staurois parvus]